MDLTDRRQDPRSDALHWRGTPTVLSSKHWEKLILTLERYVNFCLARSKRRSKSGHFESRPHQTLALLEDHTCKPRGSKLDDAELSWLKRPHGAYEAADAIAAPASGLDTSVDLMFGFPGQTIRSWHRTIKDCLKFGIRHLSIYELTLEENTPWGENPPEGLTEGYPLYRFAQWYLPKRGFIQYEIASFSLPRHWCRHNIAYWQGGNFLGIGPSAWGYLNGYRYGNASDIKLYADSISRGEFPIIYEEILPNEKAAAESAMLALRTMWGVSARAFRRKWGWQAYKKFLQVWHLLPEDCKNHSRESTRSQPRAFAWQIPCGNSFCSKLFATIPAYQLLFFNRKSGPYQPPSRLPLFGTY